MFITSCFSECSKALERQSAESSKGWRDNITCLVKNHRLVEMFSIQLWLPTSITSRIFLFNLWRCSKTNILLCNYFSFDEKQRKQTQYWPNFACISQVVNTHYSQNTCLFRNSLSVMTLPDKEILSSGWVVCNVARVHLWGPALSDMMAQWWQHSSCVSRWIRNSEISTLLLIHPGLMQWMMKLHSSFPASLEKNYQVQVFCLCICWYGRF